LGKGAGITELLHGLKGNLCQVPRWGYMIEGRVTVTYADGTAESPRAGDRFYWPHGRGLRDHPFWPAGRAQPGDRAPAREDARLNRTKGRAMSDTFRQLGSRDVWRSAALRISLELES